MEELEFQVGVTGTRATGDRSEYRLFGESPGPSTSAESSRCEVIHLAFVVAGHNASRSVATFLKTLLFYRHNPLHLHFVSDASARYVLRKLLQTWQLPKVNFSFYNAEPVIRNISWISTYHYSGVFGLLKLTVPYVLPTTMDSVIVLDTDVMMNTDISLLWRFFTVLKKEKKLLGIVENQSDWYLGKIWREHHPWPALGRGFNTGVVLLNLQAMRQSGWYHMWSTVARKYRAIPSALADQDIVNAVIKEYSGIHYTLPCSWNIQLSDNTLSKFCYQNAEDFKIIHWNSPKKMYVSNEHGPYFRSLYQTFIEYNGNLLKYELITTCKSMKKQQKLEEVTKHDDPCVSLRNEAYIQYRIHPFFLGKEYLSKGEHDVTLVSQLSMDRLQMLEPLCQYWDGPMSISVYALDIETQTLLKYFYGCTCLRQRNNVAIHVVYTDGRFYPVNYLRNIALDNTRTQYIFLSDIDFLPMPELYSYLQEAAKVLGAPKRALIVPAFETYSYKLQIPPNKTTVLKMLTNRTLTPFRYHIWPKGHAPTNFNHWTTVSRPYKVDWAPDFEPYVLLSKPFPRYDSRFTGFGWNKVSHIMELHYASYEFVVLPEPFIVHIPHSPSLDLSTFRNSVHYRDCLQVLKGEFQDDLEVKYKS